MRLRLGDLVERITYYTGIQYLVNKIKDRFEIEDCGCKKRQVKHSLNQKQFELVCQLHSKYFNHNYYKPCTCSPAIIKQWIAQIDELYETN